MAKKHHLPQCDGSFQDCNTNNGDVCKAGSTEDKCECSDDMSDCPNSPSSTNNNGLTDTQKEDSTASDAQGRPCTFGPDHDECHDEALANDS
jgi:hypothetical protein